MNLLRTEIGKMLQVERREGGFGAVLTVDGNLPIFPDHFPDQAILPGICLVQAVLLAGAIQQDVEELRIRTLKNLKFMLPVRPGQRVSIDAQLIPAGDGDFVIKAKLSVEERRCAEISLVATPIRSAERGR
jgi:3-hydroxymyristoyl/3-hydroxydecanoyl-(acyl carrier protein) dehydratase